MDIIQKACNKFGFTKRTTTIIQLITVSCFLVSTVVWLDFYVTIAFLLLVLGPVWFAQCWAIKYLYKTYKGYSSESSVSNAAAA